MPRFVSKSLKSLLVVTFSFSLLTIAAHASDALQVKTDKGKVEGSLTDDQKVRAFKGIPYAAPPVGNLRWQPPQAAAKWSGVKSAKDFGSRCIQSSGTIECTANPMLLRSREMNGIRCAIAWVIASGK